MALRSKREASFCLSQGVDKGHLVKDLGILSFKDEMPRRYELYSYLTLSKASELYKNGRKGSGHTRSKEGKNWELVT